MGDVLLLLLCCFVLSCNSEQIPRTLLPIKYDVTVTPYFETESESRFDGKLVFLFTPLKQHNVWSITLHADGLDMDSFVLSEVDNKNVSKQVEATSSYNSEQQLLNFGLGYPLSVDNTYELRINYSGRIRDDGWGLYKGFYEHEGNRRYYTVTQLRPVFARRLLPCLDEPFYKARFTLRVWRLPQFKALSNMPRVHTSAKDSISGRVMDTFAETPLMSVFLLALVVFDFSSLTTSSDQRFSTWTVPAKIHLANHGHKMIPAIVRAMETVVGSEFPMPKLDQIALPQLNPVAMENWGINTYREQWMLYAEGMFPPQSRQDVPRFTAHEVAHHWLGNLVTLQWWDWLWLSEMYAMYFEYYLPSQVEPSWRMVDQMVVQLNIPGLLEDSFNTSKPLTTHVSTNQEILAKFSGPTYTKGPALVRMIEHFMTPPRARMALRSLVQKKKYGTINPSELWQIYDLEADQLPASMETIMSSWTEQPGYPVVTVNVNPSEGIITLHQERFLLDGCASNSSLWWVPLTYTSGIKPNFTKIETRLWLTPQEPLKTTRLGLSIDSWLIFNIQQAGFYRVNYDPQNWYKIIHSLHADPASIYELNRGQLLDDSFNLARAGQLSYTIPLQLASYLAKESCYFPWAAVIPSVNFLLTRLNGHSVYDVFREYMRHLVSGVYTSVGYHLRVPDSHLQQLNRVQVVTLACGLGLPACVRDAQRHEQLTIQGEPSAVPPGLESVQLCTVLEAGVSPDNLIHQVSMWPAEDQVRAMPCVADKAILMRYLNKSLQEDSATEWRAKLAAAVTRLANIDTVFSLLTSQHKSLITRFGANNTANYFSQLDNFLSTNEQLSKIETLRMEVTDAEVSASLRTVSTNLVNRLKWITNHIPTIESWITNYNSNKENKVPSSLAYCV